MSEMPCVTCKARGHICNARPGTDECIFCEDGELCPVSTRNGEKKPAPPPMTTDGVRSHILYALANLGWKKHAATAAVDVATDPSRGNLGFDERLRIAIAQASENRSPNSKSNQQKEVSAVSRTCSVEGCHAQLNDSNKSGRCAKHWYLPKNLGGPTRKTPKRKLQPKTAPNPAKREVATFGDRTAASLIVSEKQIDAMFCGWPLEDKVMCVQAWLDRSDEGL